MAHRRTKKDDPREYIPTPDKQLEHKSGWCMTGHHSGCKYQFDHGKCGCECHKTPSPAKKRGRPKKIEEISQESIVVDEANPDPRPWKRNK